MKNISKLLTLSLLTLFIFTSCENSELEEITTSVNTKKTQAEIDSKIHADFTGRIKRVRIRKRRTGSYNIVTLVNNDAEGNQIDKIEIRLQAAGPRGQITDLISNKPIVLDRKNETKDGKYVRFINNELPFNGEPAGLLFKAVIRLKDKNGKVIEEPTVEYVTVDGNEAVTIKEPILKLKNDGETFKLKVLLKDNGFEEKSYLLSFPDIAVALKPDNGGSESNGEPNNFGFLEITRGLVYIDNNFGFMESSNVVGMSYIATVTVTDHNGEELDYAEFRIFGRE